MLVFAKSWGGAVYTQFIIKSHAVPNEIIRYLDDKVDEENNLLVCAIYCYNYFTNKKSYFYDRSFIYREKRSSGIVLEDNAVDLVFEKSFVQIDSILRNKYKIRYIIARPYAKFYFPEFYNFAKSEHCEHVLTDNRFELFVVKKK